MTNNDESMDISFGNEYTLYTRGCNGEDRCAKDISKSSGFQVDVMIGPTHPGSIQLPPSVIQIYIWPIPVHEANETLKRDISGIPRCCMELLQRNWYIIKDVTSVHAFGKFSNDKKQLKGDTGWSVQMALDANKLVYVYDVKSSTWHQKFHYRWNEKREWVNDFYFAPIGYLLWSGRVPHRTFPHLHKISVVVGSRTISTDTAKEIRELWMRTLSFDRAINDLNQVLEGMHLANFHGE